jgi:hypothetical protein
VAAHNSAVTLSQSRVFWATMNDCVFATYIRELYAREIECLWSDSVEALVQRCRGAQVHEEREDSMDELILLHQDQDTDSHRTSQQNLARTFTSQASIELKYPLSNFF